MAAHNQMRYLITLLALACCFLSNNSYKFHTHRTLKSYRAESSILYSNGENKNDAAVRNNVFSPKTMASLLIAAGSMLTPSFLSLTPFLHAQVAYARPEGVNKPELLPKDFSPLIDVANYLTKGEEKKVVEKITNLEKKTGFKLRVLCQSYPNTPGLAIKDYWKVDDNTLVMVIDQGEGFNSKNIPRNIINLNIGRNVEDTLSNLFWSRLTNKLGTTFYVREKGIDTAVLNAVEAITFCLEDKECKDIPFEL